MLACDMPTIHYAMPVLSQSLPDTFYVPFTALLCRQAPGDTALGTSLSLVLVDMSVTDLLSARQPIAGDVLDTRPRYDVTVPRAHALLMGNSWRPPRRFL